MLRDVGQRIVKETITVVGNQPIDVRLIRWGDSQRCLEVLPGEREAGRAVVRSADDHEYRGKGSLGDLTKGPSKGLAATPIINVRNQCRTKSPIGSLIGR